jgi:hypothetical protein
MLDIDSYRPRLCSKRASLSVDSDLSQQTPRADGCRAFKWRSGAGRESTNTNKHPLLECQVVSTAILVVSSRLDDVDDVRKPISDGELREGWFWSDGRSELGGGLGHHIEISQASHALPRGFTGPRQVKFAPPSAATDGKYCPAL